MSDCSDCPSLPSFYPSIEEMLDGSAHPQIPTQYRSNLLEDSPVYKKQIPLFNAETTSYFYGFDDIIKLEEPEPPQPVLEPVNLDLREYFDPNWKEKKQDDESKYPKNIIKNFMVEFQNYLTKVVHELSQVRYNTAVKLDSELRVEKIIKYFSSHKKVSNSKQLMEALSVAGTRELFIEFLEKEAPKWITRSNKLQLKQLHLLAIPYLIQAARERRKIRFPIKQWRVSPTQ